MNESFGVNCVILIEYIQGNEYFKANGEIEKKKTFLPVFKCCHKKCYEKVNVEKQEEFFDK